MVNQIYPLELQLTKANTIDTEAPFLDVHLSIAKRNLFSNIYDTRDDFDLDIVFFFFFFFFFFFLFFCFFVFGGDVPRRASYGVTYHFATYLVC